MSEKFAEFFPVLVLWAFGWIMKVVWFTTSCFACTLALVVVCSMLIGCGKHGDSFGMVQLEGCDRTSVERNLVVLSNVVVAACRECGEVPRVQAEVLGKAIAGVRLADVTREPEPLTTLWSYERFIHSSVRLLRDSLPPDIILGILLEARSRILLERERIAEAGHGNDVHAAVRKVNHLHEIDDGILVEIDELIERKVIPYYSSMLDGAEMADMLRERFRASFGHLPERRPLRWR